MVIERKQSSQNALTRREILKYGLYGGLAASLSSSLWLGGCGKRRRGKRPNIVFMLIDTLRPDHLGSYGHPGGHSPVLDVIAAEAVVFERVIAQSPWTYPSMASLFCSRYPEAHKTINPDIEKVAVLDHSFVTLAEALQLGGYSTAAFVANPFILRKFGFAQGFEHFDASFAKNTTPGNVVNDAAAAWLDSRDSNRPFFCFLHYMDVHGPYEAGPEFLDPLLDEVEALPNKRRLPKEEMKNLDYFFRLLPAVHTNTERHKRLRFYQEYWAARYDAGVRQMDRHIGELKVRLEQMGLWEDAYVIITSDHGEALFEHRHWEHGYSMHHPELHVPLFLRWPGVLTAGERIRGTVRLIDLMPTLIDQLGLPAAERLQGRSLAGDIAGSGPKKPVPAFAEALKTGPEQKAVYLDDWKLMVTPSTGKWELYNVGDDPLEQNELSSQYPLKLEQLAQMLERQVLINRQLGSEVSAERVPLTPEQRDRLRSLGYLE